MAGGFLKGSIVGAILSVAAAAIISLILPLPSPPDVAQRTPEQGIAPADGTGSAEATAPVSEKAPVVADVGQQTVEPEPDTLAEVEAIQSPSPAPAEIDVVGLELPATPEIEITQLPAAEAPVLPNPQALAPMAPEGTDPIEIVTEPAEPIVPVQGTPESVIATETVPVPEQDTAPEVLPVAEPETEVLDVIAAEQAETVEAGTAPAAVEVENATVTPEPEAQTAEAAPEANAPAQSEEEPAVTVVAEPVPGSEGATASQPEVVAEIDAIPDEVTPDEVRVPVDADTEVPGQTQEDTVVAAVDIPDLRDEIQSPQTETAAVGIGKPPVNLVDRDTGVKINRLPGIAGVTAVAQAPEPENLDDADIRTGPPIRKYAAAFDNPDERPLMSIVLIDTGDDLAGSDLDASALSSFPYPLSFAVDTSLPDATARMARYRQDGFEVLAMIDLPDGAAPADAEVTLSVMLDRIPEAVGVLEGTGGGLQGTREVSDQVTEILLQTGHGLVSQSQGLNTVPKLARKAGVPAKPVFRDFDGEGQNAGVIRRFLDQAAFKAGQEGGVIVLGRVQPETIKALLVWGLADRAGQVALAPVSAVLLKD